MNPNELSIQEKQELLRRRAGLGGTSLGIGASQINTPTSQVTQGGQGSPNVPQGSQSGAGFSTSKMTGELRQQNGESKIIINALSNRLKKLGDLGQ